MFSLFIVLLSFSESLATKCLFSNEQQYMVSITIFTIFDMNPVELKYHSFMISLNKCTGGCNVLSTKIMSFKRNKKHKS